MRVRPTAAAAPAPARARVTTMAALAALLVVTLGASAPARAWNPLKAAGKELGKGAAEAIKPVLESTIEDTFDAAHLLVADVDTRLGKQVDKVGGLATQVIGQTDKALADRISQIDGSLEKRILQIDTAASGLVKQLDKSIKQDLERADKILRDRTRDVGDTLRGALAETDQILQARIEQVDEAVGRRLANVDVIASKQRLAIEETLVRVAVLLGLVAFVVVVLVRLWRRWSDLSEAAAAARTDTPRGRQLLRTLGGSVVLQLGGAAVAAVVLLVLYQKLPMGAAHKARELTERHQRELEESLALFEFARVKFHASQLELLLPEDGRRFRAQAAKGELIRDLLSRPALLASESGVASVVERVQAVERLMGEEPDPDVLVVKAHVLWQVGRSRRDEHEAASLCARAFRVRPGGFALGPLGRSMIEDFLETPYFRNDTPLGRDSETLPFLRTVLTSTDKPRPGFPMAHVVALAAATRRLERASSNAYVAMLEAHAAWLGKGGAAALRRRGELGAEVVAAWDAFDREIQEIPGLGGTPAVLAVFQLNDAYYRRAKWFVVSPKSAILAPRAGTLPPDEELKLAPPRVVWARRYATVLGRNRDLVEHQEAERYRRFEELTATFDQDLVGTLLQAPGDSSGGARAVVGADPPATVRRRAALAAARLGLYVDRGGTGARAPYALVLLGDGAERRALDEALELRTRRLYPPERKDDAPAGKRGDRRKGA